MSTIVGGHYPHPLDHGRAGSPDANNIRHYIYFVSAISLASLVFNVPSASAKLLFDNGAPVEATSDLRFNNLIHTIYDGFTLSADSIVTGFEWSQFDEPVSYTDTVLTLYDGTPTPSSFIAEFTLSASRSSNGLMVTTGLVPSGELFGFNYSVAGLSHLLSAGTYHL